MILKCALQNNINNKDKAKIFLEVFLKNFYHLLRETRKK